MKVPPPAREPIAGEELKLTAEARYLYGAPLRGGTLTWRVYRRIAARSLPEAARLRLQRRAAVARSWYDSRSAASEPLVGENEQRLDKNGRAKLSLTLQEGATSSRRRTSWSPPRSRTRRTRPSPPTSPSPPTTPALYFGIDRGSPIGAAEAARAPSSWWPSTRRATGSPRTAPSGRAARLELRLGGLGLSRQLPLREEGRRGDAPGGQRRAPSAPPEVKFTPPGSGEYELIVEGKDAAGNATAGVDVLLDLGRRRGVWQAEDNERFDIIADKPSYKVGETARLLLKTTLRDATGLLTIERDGVIEQRLVTVGAGTSTVDVPIKEGYGPNVYASVMLVKGRTGKGARGAARSCAWG